MFGVAWVIVMLVKSFRTDCNLLASWRGCIGGGGSKNRCNGDTGRRVAPGRLSLAMVVIVSFAINPAALTASVASPRPTLAATPAPILSAPVGFAPVIVGASTRGFVTGVRACAFSI